MPTRFRHGRTDILGLDTIMCKIVENEPYKRVLSPFLYRTLAHITTVLCCLNDIEDDPKLVFLINN